MSPASFLSLLKSCLASLRSRSRLLAENLALRQQLAVLHRQSKRPQLKNRDRWFWIVLCRFFSGWESCLIIMKPETVIR